MAEASAGRALKPTPASALGGARLRRRLTVEKAARRAGLTAEEVEWLEEGRVYRFRTTNEALATAVVYATALDLEHHEARELAGLPVGRIPPTANRLARAAALGAAAVAIVAFLAVVLLPDVGRHSRGAAARDPATGAPLAPPWRVDVDVLNGAGDINFTRQVASRIGAIGYRIHRVARASRFDYVRTVVYYEPRGRGLAIRLARQLGVVTMPLPGGRDPHRLVVIVGPHKGPGD
ncbi:MAG TPA: LytR C-terminal domain-containing protein [Gaiellaceae bacterium]